MIRDFNQVTGDWLTQVTQKPVVTFTMVITESNWARHAKISATQDDGSPLKLWLKICLHAESGRSEVDYYQRDYATLPNAPLLKCYDAAHEPGHGYHLLFDDLSDEFQDRKHVQPTLEHGLELAGAVGRMHAHHWQSGSPKDPAEWEPPFARLRRGIENLEQATGKPFAHRFEKLAKDLADRWSQPIGMAMLHGDINPTNVLTPKEGESPLYILDRQPLDGKTPYGVAVYDLAYAIAPWWPRSLREEHEEAILRHWFETLAQPTYPWEQARADWRLSVEHCLFVIADWCVEAEECESMRWLWGWQLENLDGQSGRG